MTPFPVTAGFLGETGSWTLVVLGVGLLIFIHEAGHFMAAKWAGVRVLAFSLGFGPEMFGFTRGHTRYRVAWIPLGGYVKMSGETERPEGGFAPDDFPAQPVWKRGIIMIAGVVMNAVLGFLLFAAAALSGIHVSPPVAGMVRHGGPAWEAGIRPGDRFLETDGHPVRSFEDVMYATMAGESVAFSLEREGKPTTIAVLPVKEEGAPAPAIGVVPPLGRVLAVPDGGSAAAAGFRDGDAVVAVEGVEATLWDLLRDPVFAGAVLPRSGPLVITVERAGQRVDVPVEPAGTHLLVGVSAHRTTIDRVRAGGPAEAAGWRAGDRPEAVGPLPLRGVASFRTAAFRAPPASTVRVRRGEGSTELPLPDDAGSRMELLRDLRFAPSESPTAVEILPEGPPAADGSATPSPAEAAGIPNGARITAVGGAEVVKFEDVQRRLAAAEGKPVEVSWTGPDGGGSSTLVPLPFPSYQPGALDFAILPERELLVVDGPVGAAAFAVERCVQTTRQIVATVSGIFGGTVGGENLGGPVAIARLTKQSTESGAGQFFAILAMLSINLMFLNILPIPLLDGGQLMLLSVEAVTRKPPQEWLVVFSQWLGLVVLLGLMLLVTFNDIARLVGS